MKRYLAPIITFLILTGLLPADESGKHLFILSGQSNMARFKPDSWFTPGVSEVLGADKVIVSFHARGGQPISKWHKQWKSGSGETDVDAGKIYNELMEKTKAKIEGEKIQSVTFIWMQGEADSKAGNSDVYLASLNGLKQQLEKDLERTDINFIIGRLSDSGFYQRRDRKLVENKDWQAVREAQETFADASDSAVWIDTDDLNGEKNQLHLIKPDGYAKLGERYVEAAVKLVKAAQSK
ncbi:MAG: sialate O-acetylesterase [Verrucomicrobiota bacterium]